MLNLTKEEINKSENNIKERYRVDEKKVSLEEVSTLDRENKKLNIYNVAFKKVKYDEWKRWQQENNEKKNRFVKRRK